MYSMDDLLYLLHSDGADALRLQAGEPPMVIMDGEPQKLEGAALTAADLEDLFQSIADTRQRRELRERGSLEFLHRFRGRATFVIRARLENEIIHLEIR